MAPATVDDAVVVEGLVRAYGEVRAVDGLSLRARTGAVTAVLGPNGAGKTTTVEVCQGLRTRDAGAVTVLGLDPGTRAGHRALVARVGVMPQTAGAWPGIRCREMLALVATSYAHPLPVDDLLERLGLQTCADTAVRRLSGGQQQRLSLAVAVVGRPELAFLDEPSAGLDVQARLAMWDLVRDLRTAGASVVLTTHDMDEAEALADDVVIVDHGRRVAAGSLASLVRGAPQVRFLAPPGTALAELPLPEGCTVAEPEPGSFVITGRADPQLLADVTAWAAARGLLLRDVRTGDRSLEDVFLELTGRGLRA